LTVAKVRDLIQHTSLTYAQITARTGVCGGTISCWTRERKWVRPPDAARPWDRDKASSGLYAYLGPHQGGKEVNPSAVVQPHSALILRSGLLAASRRIGHKRSRPSFETPRKRAAPQDEAEHVLSPGRRIFCDPFPD